MNTSTQLTADLKINGSLASLALIAVCCAVGLGVFIPLLMDFGLKMQIVFFVAMFGIGVSLLMPNRRIALVCTWIFVHPLSLEKVFSPFQSTHEGFMAQAVVLSGSDLVFYFLVCLLIFEYLSTDKRQFVIHKAAYPLIALFIWVVINFFLGKPSGEGFVQVGHWFKMLIMLITFSSSIRTKNEIYLVLIVMAAAIIGQSLVLGASHVMGSRIGFSDKISSAHVMKFSSASGGNFSRATGTVGHVNQQAMFHTFLTIPLVSLLMVRNHAWKIYGAIAIFGSLLAVILTFSRASWIAWSFSGLAFLILGILFKKINRTGWLAIVFGGMIGFAAVSVFVPAIFQRLFLGDEGASSSRVRMMKLAVENLSVNPFTGVGPGNFVNAKIDREDINWAENEWLARGEYFKVRSIADLELYPIKIENKKILAPGTVHNKYLLMLAEYGIPGFILFLWWQWNIFRAALYNVFTKIKDYWWLAASLLVFFFALHIEFQFELFYDDKTVATPIFCTSLILALNNILRRQSKSQKENPLELSHA